MITTRSIIPLSLAMDNLQGASTLLKQLKTQSLWNAAVLDAFAVIKLSKKRSVAAASRLSVEFTQLLFSRFYFGFS